MRIAYIHKRGVRDADGMDADKLFADDETTRRVSRSDLLDHGGLRSGDVLVLRSEGDLGSRRSEVDAMLSRVADIGATVEIVPMDRKPVKVPKGHRKPLPDKLDRMCILWRSSLDAAHVIDRCGDIAGFPVTRNNMNQWCGSRHKRDK